MILNAAEIDTIIVESLSFIVTPFEAKISKTHAKSHIMITVPVSLL